MVFATDIKFLGNGTPIIKYTCISISLLSNWTAEISGTAINNSHTNTHSQHKPISTFFKRQGENLSIWGMLTYHTFSDCLRIAGTGYQKLISCYRIKVKIKIIFVICNYKINFAHSTRTGNSPKQKKKIKGTLWVIIIYCLQIKKYFIFWITLKSRFFFLKLRVPNFLIFFKYYFHFSVV